MPQPLSRRQLLKTSAYGLGTASLVGSLPSDAAAAVPDAGKPAAVRYCLNTSTIREAKLSLPELVNLAADAGYDGIEPWVNEIDRFIESGGKLADVRKQLEDRNLRMESAIGFPRWAVDDEQERRAGFEEARRGMDLVKQLGGSRIAAPPIGMNAVSAPVLDLRQAAERYHALLELGVAMEVIPQLEIWGPSKNLSRLAEACFVAVAADHPQAAILPDIYHLYRGGSDFHGLRLLSGEAIQIFHVNDYPASPEREKQTDADRVYPGDGVAPLDLIFGSLRAIGFAGALSLELFNRDYWKQDPAEVAKTGLRKMKSAFEKSQG